MTAGPKLIYLTKRHPSLSRPDFVHWWRQHWLLANRNERWRNVRRYVQCEVLEEATRLAGGATEQDGLAVVTFHSEASRLAHREDGGAQAAMEIDERRLFADLIRNQALVAHESVVLDGPCRGVKLVRFFKCRPGIAREEAQAAWREAGQGQANCTYPHALRYVQDYALARDRSEGWGLLADIVEEVWFDGTAPLLADLRAAEGRHVRLVGESTRVVTDEVVLTDNEPGRPWTHPL